MILGTLSWRRRVASVVGRGAMGICAAIAVGSLAWLLGLLFLKGASHLDLSFITEYPSANPTKAGVWPALLGTLWIGGLSMVFAIPVGIAAAVYLNEFARPGRVTSLLRASISNLAGVPSVVFGILGLALFVRQMALGRSLLAAGLTLAILTLPIIIVVAEESLKTVPRSIREAAFALGASRWQVVRHHVLPYALPGMLTGAILALSRSMGETAPLILIGAFAYLAFPPTSPLDVFTALPIQAYYWAQDSKPAFHDLAWSAVLLLVLVTFIGNLAAVLIRDRHQRRYRW